MSDVTDETYVTIARAVLRGLVTPFLGAAAGVCDRPPKQPWRRGRELPSGSELAQHLASRFASASQAGGDLLQASQYIATMHDEGTLYDELRDVFAGDYTPTSVHRFLATLPSVIRRSPGANSQVIIGSTNYDHLMERALSDAGEAHDVLWYEAKPNSPDVGRFWHRGPGGSHAEIIPVPNEWGGDFPANERLPCVLKLHGAVMRDALDSTGDSYVVSEDDYIRYMSGRDVAGEIPKIYLDSMINGHFLFLGYRLRDWNLRVVLERLTQQQPLKRASWAVQRDVTDIDVKLWSDRRVKLLDIDMVEFVKHLGDAIDAEFATPSAA